MPIPGAPGGAAPYLTPDELRNILAGQQTGQQTTDYAGTAAVLSDAELEGTITQAQAEVDGRLATRYTTPFDTPPQLVIDLTGDIAAYLATLVYRRGNPIAPTDPIQLRNNRAEAMLGQAVAGTLILTVPGSDPGQPEAATGSVAVVNPTSGDLWTEGDFALTQRPCGVDSLTTRPLWRPW